LISIAIDTCEPRGSIAVRKTGKLCAVRSHASKEEYSSWLIPAVMESLNEAETDLNGVDLLAVATGPGSFTGVRVGLTTVKAWAEVFHKPIVGVSRLEALARRSGLTNGFVAACYDAHRGQVFGAAYRVSGGVWRVVESEIVTSPSDFLSQVAHRAGVDQVAWISLDPQLLTDLPAWQKQVELGSRMIHSGPQLADTIGEIAEERASKHLFTDILDLDANYVRRSDAEVFWKPPNSHGR
jgi:tRNA threonylcarbamoyladenosine biosynthesis protein TsaB